MIRQRIEAGARPTLIARSRSNPCIFSGSGDVLGDGIESSLTLQFSVFG